MTHNFERVRISGQLTVLTPLSIGMGAMPTAIEGRDGQEGNYLDLCAHPDGTPFIPGSSVRGLLSALLGKYTRDKEPGPYCKAHRLLFGEARGDQRDSRGGCLRVYDASLCKAGMGGKPKVDRTRTAIDPITGTAKDNSLFKLAQIPANGQFLCEFELDRIDRELLETFLGLLNQLDEHNPQARLGRGASKSEGRVEWTLESVKTLSSRDLAAWLVDAKPCFDDCFAAQKILNPKKLNWDNAGRFKELWLRLYPQGPLLVDPERRGVKGQPDMVARRESRAGKTCLIVPAASLRGLLRAHCRKILMTLLVDKLKDEPHYERASGCADELIARLFGHEKRAGAIILQDARGENLRTHIQTFNAVDRFTGGVADTALYTVDTAYVTQLDTVLSIDLDRLQGQGDWWKGLLVLVLRDAMEGDLALGWGKAKGYGVFKMGVRRLDQQNYIDDWDKLRAEPDIVNAPAWIKALHEELGNRVLKRETSLSGQSHNPKFR